ncbi:MAG: heavy metal-associated domain-containing protein [Bacteroidia bacterium]
MKKQLILTAIFAALSFASVFAQSKTKQVIIKTIIYCDHCKECASCSPRILHELNYTKGVKVAKLDVATQTITVDYNPQKTDVLKIKTAISKMGYDADDIKADAKGYEALDGCCKKSN